MRFTMAGASDREASEDAAPIPGSMEGVLERYASAPGSATLRAAILTWGHGAARLPIEARLELLARIATRIERAELPCRALLPIVLGDADGRVVAAALAPLAFAHKPDAADPEPGPFYILKHALTSEPGNLGAVLGALLGLGDPAVARWIFELRHLLVHPRLTAALAEMTRCHTGMVHKATVAFYLDWLDELADRLPASAETFGRVANGLVDLRTHSISDHLVDGCLYQPSLVDRHRTGDGLIRISLREFTRSVWPRLVALERVARPSAAMCAVLDAWDPEMTW